MTGARGSWRLLAKKPHGRLCLNMGILPSSHVPLACGFCPRHRQSQLGVLVARGVLSPLAFFTCPEGPRASSPHPDTYGRATCAQVVLTLSHHKKRLIETAGSALIKTQTKSVLDLVLTICF